MAGLCCGVDNKRWHYRFDKRIDFFAVTDINFMMDKNRVQRLKSVLVVARIAAWTEEICTHIVVRTINLPALPAEIVNNFRPNQTRRASNK